MPILVQLLKTTILVVQQMWRRWYVIVASIFLSIAFVVTWAQIHPPQYETTMTVTAPQSGGSGLSGLMNALGGSSDLLGGVMGGGQSSQFESYLALLKSSSVSEQLVHDPHIMKLLFGPILNPVTGEWKDSFGRRLKGVVYGAFGLHGLPRPTPDDMGRVLNDMLVINVAPLNRSMATVSCTSSDPYTCRELMLAVNHAAQARLDTIALDNSKRMTVYLENILSTVNELSLRQALTTAMANTEVQAALTGVGGQQRAVVLDGPIAPSMPAFPKPTVLILLAIFMGFVLGGALVWLARNTSFDRFMERKANHIRLRLLGQAT